MILGPTSRPRGQILLLGSAWLITRLALADDLHWFGRRTSYEDVSVYRAWAHEIVHTHHLPTGTSWQYPVGAALLFLLAEIGPGHYDRTFCLIMLACDLGITATLASVAYREHRFHGVWAWLIATTGFGPIILLRFDLAPTLALVAALAVLWRRRRAALFGSLIGVGVLLKVWPVLGLLAARTWREVLRAALWCGAMIALVTAVSSVYFGDTLGFISNQAGRGLELDSVAASPWFLLDAFTRSPLRFQFASGATDLSGAAEASVASGLHVLMAVTAVAIAGWWMTQARAGDWVLSMRAGRRVMRTRTGPHVTRTRTGRSVQRGFSGGERTDEGTSDAVLTALLWYLVLSPVLSPQYFIWVMGLGSLLLCARETRMQRPLILLGVTLILTRVLMQSGPQLYATHLSGSLDPTTLTCLELVARNLALLLAAIDASRLMLRRRP